MATYIPAFLAAATPDGASSKTKQLLGSTLPWKKCNAIASGKKKDSSHNILKRHGSYKCFYMLESNTSNLLAAARKISGDGLPVFTSGSSPVTT